MLNEPRSVLQRLRTKLFQRTEQAYTDRDAKGVTDQAKSFAAGEAHAYGMAEKDVRDAQKERGNER